ncbi:vanadium-dependent haloperoxidase [Streptomyces sp. NPDC002734]|uniref:vanadium-dependent haloperoxidase n=1 Tax=Streptomyces sp. NPDC002734 TaxID=3154426 RepID=UPI00331DA233
MTKKNSSVASAPLARLAVGLAALVSALPTAATAAAEEVAPPVGRDPAVVSDWMRTAADTIADEVDGTPPDRAFWEAYAATAVYNAVTGIEGRYASYRWRERGPRHASSTAAAAAAAHRLLTRYFPASAAGLDTALAATLAKIPDGRAEREGVAFGRRAADHVVELRANDGRGAPVSFDRPPAPGVWRPAPPAFAPFSNAWLGRMRPLLLRSPDMFRPGPPPAPGSARYVRDLAEVRAFGAKDSTRRTPAQTDTARFFTELDLPGALGDHAARHRLDISATARLYAAVHTTQADAIVAAWDAKLRYGNWRPITAIHRADEDGSPATSPDPGWEPLLTTPAHPDYLSGHATTAGALTGTMTKLLGSDRIDLTVHSTRGGTTRHYEHAGPYDRDAIDARVFAGIHTRTADVVGNRVGHRIADWALDRYFRPLRGH